MAEYTGSPLTNRDISSIKFIDGTTPTANEYTLQQWEGTVTINQGQHNQTYALDENGERMGAPRRADPAAFASATMDVVVWQAGDDSTNVNILDVLMNDGAVASGWTSTTNGVSGEDPTWDLEITIADRTDVAGSTIKGATILLTDCHITNGRDLTTSRTDPIRVAVSVESKAVHPTITVNP